MGEEEVGAFFFPLGVEEEPWGKAFVPIVGTESSDTEAEVVSLRAEDHLVRTAFAS